MSVSLLLGGICQTLDDAKIIYRLVHHEPTRTSEQSAAARGESIKIGGKALLIKVGEEFRLFVLSATRRRSESTSASSGPDSPRPMSCAR